MHVRRLLLVVLVLAALPALAGPAAAHDKVVAQSPERDARLVAAPDAVTLRFGGTPLQVGATVMVVDPAGRDWAAGEPVVRGSVVTQRLDPGMGDGWYQARWRVVSEDGSPLSESFDFAVGEVVGGARVAVVASGDEPVEESADDAVAFVDAAPVAAGSGPASSWLLRNGLLGALAGLLVAAALGAAARSRSRRPADGRASSSAS
ncbi:copper resistance CopC family protein [Motilibacter aurantiacus]|uniref:copper resistance CopC family protein n=1 Tax=Motilibacter aurantiacus TaxID=2714955 RepID=UPI001407E2D4|nr:copper resistance protein CopC [Motilibacter aurantiacus]